LLVHGWWNIAGAKMSKSTGNVVDPNVLIDMYGVEAVRYYLLSDISLGRDADFSEKRLVERYNADLANTLGNLINRTLNMAQQYRQGRLSNTDVPLANVRFLEDTAGFGLSAYEKAFDSHEASKACEEALTIAAQCNVAIDAEKPWTLAKKEEKQRDLDAILYHLAESLRIIAILISPVLPKAAHGIFDQLSWKMELSGREERFSLKDSEWGGLPDGHVVGKPVPLFPKIETIA
jgi:methionyl-tRNA synthetase